MGLKSFNFTQIGGGPINGTLQYLYSIDRSIASILLFSVQTPCEHYNSTLRVLFSCIMSVDGHFLIPPLYGVLQPNSIPMEGRVGVKLTQTKFQPPIKQRTRKINK